MPFLGLWVDIFCWETKKVLRAHERVENNGILSEG